MRLFEDERVSHFPYRRARTPEETERYLEREIRGWTSLGYGRFGVRLAAGGRFAGVVGPAPATWPQALLPAIEIGWRLVPSCWGRGLASEAAAAVVEWLDASRFADLLVCLYDPANEASARIAARLGMRRWGTAEHPAFGTQCIEVLPLCTYQAGRQRTSVGAFRRRGE